MTQLRYNRRWVRETLLGRSLRAVTLWDHAVPRVGGLFPGITTPMPQAKPHDFESICLARAEALWSQYSELLVLWSGGTDSTMVAALLAHTKPAGKTLFVSHTPAALENGQEALTALIGKGVVAVPFSPSVVEEVTLRGGMSITGYHADGILLGDFYDQDGEAIMGLSIHEMVALRTGMTPSLAMFHLQQLKPLIDLMPLEKNALNIAWWMDFATFWDRDEYDLHYRLGIGKPGEAYTSFFSAVEFQEWAIRDVTQKIGMNGQPHKKLYLSLIDKYLGGITPLKKNYLENEIDQGNDGLFHPNLLQIREDYSLLII